MTEAAEVAWLWRDLAGRRGFPEIIEGAAAVLPESTTANVVYDLGVALSLALGDLADAVEVASDRSDSQGSGLTGAIAAPTVSQAPAPHRS
ncbi:MAG: hypothetical protein Q4P32_01705 [Micrococcales bacterium]|nr:hypothetical protein [Micrococcales bacterium]